MKIIGVIPARSGSKRIPNKNIRILNDKPLIAYTIQAGLNSNLDKIIVSTDSEEIAVISKDLGAEVIMRSADLSADQTPTLPVIQDAIDKIDGSYEAVMTLQPTSPLRTSQHINDAIDLFKSDKHADSLVSVVKIPHNFVPEKLMKFDGKYLVDFIQPKRSQDVEPFYARNGAAIYITKTSKINKYIFGGVVLPFFMKKEDSVDLDDNYDWRVIESLMSQIVN